MTRPSCTVTDSGMGAASFVLDGAGLRVRMDWVESSPGSGGGPEEMVAVLSGSAVLVSGDDRHPLAAGQGALIPAGAPRRWEIAGRALVYSVSAAQ